MERDLIEMDGWNGRMAERAAEAESTTFREVSGGVFPLTPILA